MSKSIIKTHNWHFEQPRFSPVDLSENQFHYVEVRVIFTATVIGLCAGGCAADLARSSSPAIGCAPDEIEIDEVSVGWSETSWSARCRGTRFHCAGEHGASCSPDRDVANTAQPTPSAP